MLALYASYADDVGVSRVASGHEHTESETLLNPGLIEGFLVRCSQQGETFNMTTQHVLE